MNQVSPNSGVILADKRAPPEVAISVEARAKSLFATLDLPQEPDALRILDEEGRELFFWSPGPVDP